MPVLSTLQVGLKTTIPSGAAVIVSVPVAGGGRTYDVVDPRAIVTPVATSFVAGSVKPDGTTVRVAADGTVSAALPIATTSLAGGVKPDGTTVRVATDGTVSVPTATTAARGTVKPDGTTLTVAVDGTASVSGVAVTGLPTTATSQGTDLLTINRNGADYAEAVSDFLAANSGSVTQLPAGPGLADTDVIAVYSAAAGADVRYTMAQFKTYLGYSTTTTTSSTAPSAVGSLAAGTPTSTTVPLTWVTPSGTAPFTYAVSVAPHGSTSFTTAAGTFGNTGGTVTGLTASTNYDFRVIANNSVGAGPAATLTAGVVTAAVTVRSPILQRADVVNQSTGSSVVTLPAAPTVGNKLLMIITGRNTNESVAGFTQTADYNDATNQEINLYTRTVASGDGTGWTINNFGDYKFALLLELPAAATIATSAHGAPTVSGSTTTAPALGAFTNNYRILVFEQDNGNQTIAGVGFSGTPGYVNLAPDFSAATPYHGAFIAGMDAGTAGNYAITWSGAVTNAVYADIVIGGY